jgi:type IV secretory pathway TraG/TraD family ATPase VirD4
MKRAEPSYEKQRDFYLYVDECHNLTSENFMELLAEAHKYRMGLVLATQYSAQLTSSIWTVILVS